MVVHGRTRNCASRADKFLITKIITALGLALLLVVGAWPGGHRDATDATPYLSTTSSSALGTPSTGHVSAGSGESVAGATAEQFVTGDTANDIMIGVAGCLLGIICCFLVLIVTRTFRRHIPSSRIRERLPRAPSMAALTGRLFALPPSLTQLSLSRT
ncbi:MULTISPECIES: hypothetical protein [Microbacterium]|uniref:Uncharacterized protein n=1 Tax=Microbacterium maritypicum TaxID=33918 RepID=A0ACD4B8P4_MICMQ|nr:MULTISPECIES: hypothetical protein [Microbacterium]UTT53613.1 hypothetical protein NMQ05_03270 [Microbacterium liquefaciens]UUE21295.1 hypothetical protein LRQ07_03245 [Microbacterium sp. J1-1]WKT87728.1 hypothetical protein QYR02_09660 [Microbacterium liquefaciens]